MIEIISIGIGIYLLYAGLIGVDNYQILRVIVFIGGLLLLFYLRREENINPGTKTFYLIFTTILILIFNPIIPLYLYDRTLWALIDIVSGAILVVTFLFIKASHDSFLENMEKIPSKKRVTLSPDKDTKINDTDINFIPLISKYISLNFLLNKLEILMIEQSQNNKNAIKYDVNNYKNLINYHLVCYLSSLLKIYLSTDNEIALIKVNGLINNLELELIEFRNNYNTERYDIFKPILVDEDTFVYERICSLREVEPPYFSQVRYNDEDYRNVSISLVTNLALILQPRNLQNAGVPYQQFVTDLRKIAINIINDTFSKNNT